MNHLTAQSAQHPRSRPARRERGTSLLEALVGLLLIAAGMLGSAQLQVRLRQSTDLARQQADAARIAQQELETLRAFASNELRPGVASFAAITSQTRSVSATVGSTTSFSIARQVGEEQIPATKPLGIFVGWTDRGGVNHQRSLFTMIGGQSPALILAMGQRPVGGSAGQVFGRHPAIPLDAFDLGDGRSVFKPVVAAADAWLFDNRSGRIIQRCSTTPPNRTSHQLTAADLNACSSTDEVLLSGRIRHALAPLPTSVDANTARDTPLAMSTNLQLAGSGHAGPPVCLGEAVRMVDVGTPASPLPIAVPIGATAASQGRAGWTELNDQFWRYHCAVSLAPPPPGGDSSTPQWSGQLLVTPTGWSLGSTAGARKVCRYSADTDSSGVIDRAAEAPGNLLGVTDALVEQNYLIVDGAQPCPTLLASTAAAGSLPWSNGNPATVQHQP